MINQKDKLIVALDVETLDEARRLVDVLGSHVDIYKIGSQLFTRYGPEAVRHVLRAGKRVFLDLKFHDIPNTVAAAVSSAVSLVENGRGIMMCTVHTLGGKEMLERAVEAVLKQAQKIGIARPFLVGITVLTSDQKKDGIPSIVLERAVLAKEAGLDGVVASSQEAAMIRRELGKDFLIVTPGIRPAGATVGDQKRVTTPADAIKNGSNFLVVGRPIVEALDPVAAVRQILKEIRVVL